MACCLVATVLYPYYLLTRYIPIVKVEVYGAERRNFTRPTTQTYGKEVELEKGRRD